MVNHGTSNVQLKSQETKDEPVHYEDLARALVMFCRQDGEFSSKDLSDRLSKIQAQLNITRNQVKRKQVDAYTIEQNIQGAMDELMEAVVSLQFFDRISQRMEHAISSIEAVFSPSEIRKHFTMEDERILFDALANGETVDNAVAAAMSRLGSTVDKKGTDIELF